MSSIFKRVSIRHFENRDVEYDKIESVLKAAMAAPSAGNQQPWEFYVVTNKEKIQALSKASLYAGCAVNAPAVIVPCYRTAGLRFPEFDLIDLSIATENILLRVTELDLGAVWLAIAPIEERMNSVENILDIPDELRAFALVPIGYLSEQKTQKDRFEKSRIHFVK